jgi:hypothetical protein
MNPILFKPYEGNDFDELGKIALDLLKNLSERSNFSFPEDIPLKVHFGEKGNKTYIPAETYTPMIDYFKNQGSNPLYIETNVLYRGARTTSTSHMELAKSHGFTQIPIVLADGETGIDYTEVEINKDFFSHCKIGKAFSNYDQYLILSHFKGHGLAGFGGALKQLAMGFASRSGKMAQHSAVSPVINSSKCIACGICVEKCDFDAINLTPKAVIDDEKCTGCAGCIAVCPEGAIRNKWDASNFLEHLAEYAYGASLGKRNLYISFLINITEDCDCIGSHMHPVAPNIGVLAGTDPVAVDSACLDLLQQTTDSKLFEKGRVTLVHAEKIGLGSSQYELIKL